MVYGTFMGLESYMATLRELSHHYFLEYGSLQLNIERSLLQTNVLVTDDLRCCLGDFGLVSVMETQFATTATSGVTQGTVRWMAPELLDHSCVPPGGSQTHTASDIYAFGCTVYEVIYLLV
jgi:serine/threonine protein kinase